MVDPTIIDVCAQEFPSTGCEPMLLFWYLEVGAQVKEGQGLCEVETTKTVFLVCAPVAGTLVEICVGPGEPLRSGQLLARISQE